MAKPQGLLSPLERQTYESFGIAPREDRLSILPRYSQQYGLIAPQFIYDAAKALAAPYTAAQGYDLPPEEALNVGMNVMGGGSVGSAPRGALSMAVGSAPRKLPLGDYGEITRFSKPLPKGELYREVSGESFMDMSKGNNPMGSPITYFAESPEMALGQGKNKGIMYQINSEGLKGRPNFDKPGLESAYMARAGEFTLTEQPSNILKSLQNVWVSPEAYKGLSKGQKVYLDRYLNDLQKSGVQVNKVDKLPNKLD
jgi:hypothetical protein